MSSSCRFAPTASGHLHIGSLCNLLLSYIVAKKDGSDFYVRVDRHPDQMKYEAEILKDIEAFGFEPDKIILQREREERYKEAMDHILDEHLSSGQVYYCNCSPEDIAFRGSTKGGVRYLHREEKYPSPCDIVRVKAFSDNDPDRELISEADVWASISSRDHAPENVREDTESFWRPKDEGYLGPCKPELRFHWKTPVWISSVEIETLSYPLCGYSLVMGGTRIEIKKPNLFYYGAQLGKYIKERICFSPEFTRSLIIYPTHFVHQVKKAYFYDGHCHDRNLSLYLGDKSTTVRTKGSSWTLPDVAIWFDGQMDLCCTSAIDDMDHGIDVCVRGIDIEPFTLLEGEAAKLIGWKPPNLFHPMLVDEQKVKFSKFINSPRAVDLLSRFSKEQVLSYVARKLGILPFHKEAISLQEIVKMADIDYMEDVRTPVVCRLDKEL